MATNGNNFGISSQPFTLPHHYLQSVYDSVPCAIFSIDMTHTIIGCNTNVTKFFGWNEDDIVDKEFLALFGDDSSRKRYLDCFQTNESLLKHDFKCNFLKKVTDHVTDSSSSISVQVSVNVIIHHFDDQVLITVYILDTTSIQRLVISRNELLNGLETIIEAAGLYLFVKDDEGVFTEISDNARQDFPEYDFVGHVREEVFEDIYHHSLKEITDQVYVEGKVTVNEISINVRGQQRWFLLSATPRRNEDGNIVGMYVLVQDITEYKTLMLTKSEIDRQHYLLLHQQFAQESSSLHDEFLSNISHEIRTPLHGITGMLTLLEYTSLTSVQTEYIKEIRNSTDQLLSVMNDLLDFSKIAGEIIHLDNIDFDVYNMLNESSTLYGVKARLKELEFFFHNQIQERYRYIRGDPRRFHQIVKNLLDNAIKFTFDGSVTMSAKVVPHYSKVFGYVPEDDYGTSSDSGASDLVYDQDNPPMELHIQVSDTGIGIASDKLPSLFKHFTQVDSNKSRQFMGTGLGLSISYNLVKLMHGRIGVHSQVGVGSTFWIRLPLVLGTKPSQILDPNIATCSTYNLKGKRVLIVDDNSTSRKIAVKLLERIGIETFQSENGIEALRLLQSSDHDDFDLILLDIFMPVMDGYETAVKLRQLRHPTNSIPIIAMTANSIEDEQYKCLSLGMDDYITKPVSADMLYCTIQKWINKRHEN